MQQVAIEGKVQSLDSFSVHEGDILLIREEKGATYSEDLAQLCTALRNFLDSRGIGEVGFFVLPDRLNIMPVSQEEIEQLHAVPFEKIVRADLDKIKEAEDMFKKASIALEKSADVSPERHAAFAHKILWTLSRYLLSVLDPIRTSIA